MGCLHRSMKASWFYSLVWYLISISMIIFIHQFDISFESKIFIERSNSKVIHLDFFLHRHVEFYFWRACSLFEPKFSVYLELVFQNWPCWWWLWRRFENVAPIWIGSIIIFKSSSSITINHFQRDEKYIVSEREKITNHFLCQQ